MTILHPFHIKELRTTDNEGWVCHSYLPAGWQERKRTFILVKEDAGWDDSEI
uniref:Uncharacterized protein n=2 Tax=Ursus TaxID=9639 RepID=A0A452VE92_URSMA